MKYSGVFLVLKEKVYNAIATDDINFIMVYLVIVLEYGEKGLLSTSEKNVNYMIY